MSPAPRRVQSSTLLSALMAPLLLTGAAAPVIAQMGRTGLKALPAAPTGGPTVRVLLAAGSNWALPAQAFPLRLLDSREQPLRRLSPDERLRLTTNAAGVVAEVVSPDGATRRLPVQAGGLWLEPQAEKGEQSFLAFGKERYRGRVQIRLNQAGSLMAINHLPLETYLASVVGSEMPASWPQAALQAQAVAARTYALSHLKPAAAYDVKSTVASQVYRGLAAETDSTRAAVAATTGKVLMQNGKLILAVFHSSSGGSTEDSGQVWSRQLPYLVSVPDFDKDSPVSRWNLRLEPDQLRSLFRETGGVRRIDVLATSNTGRIRRARVIGPAGSLDLSGTELRQRLGLRSTLVSFSLQPLGPGNQTGVIDQAVRGSLSAPALSRGWSQPAATAAAAPRPAPPPSRTEPLVDSATGAVIGDDDDGPETTTAAAPTPQPVFRLPAAATPPEPRYALLVEGRGFGHGVGMSQWGAYAMAQQGRSYEQILRHYYRGVELLSYPSP
ncbi:SpoIID/LytB domain-containing protein [Synechococcus sp. CBW1004]|uniref:SpoIID/LytB domain-containing protein n=1 Tax=Synechococcus sp. CBW1004 TaxID=1353136 RepID=UPI001E5276BE|nr:SpoIID/LytB domain-containing protein [Synechococcus sp. CBW1004]